eukprot:COSAG01_NODE_861_length_13035_cov_6.890449_3_plen_43_part_00
MALTVQEQIHHELERQFQEEAASLTAGAAAIHARVHRIGERL